MRRGTARLAVAMVATFAVEALLLPAGSANALNADALPMGVALGIPLHPPEDGTPTRCTVTVSTSKIEYANPPSDDEQWGADVVAECAENDDIFIDLRSEIHSYTANDGSAGVGSGPDTDAAGYTEVNVHPTMDAYAVPQGGGVKAHGRAIFTYPYTLDRSEDAGPNCVYLDDYRIDCRAHSEYVPNPHPAVLLP